MTQTKIGTSATTKSAAAKKVQPEVNLHDSELADRLGHRRHRRHRLCHSVEPPEVPAGRQLESGAVHHWAQDQSLRSAIKYSDGQATYEEVRQEFQVCHQDVSGANDNFWLNGTLKISADEPVQYHVESFRASRDPSVEPEAVRSRRGYISAGSSATWKRMAMLMYLPSTWRARASLRLETAALSWRTVASLHTVRRGCDSLYDAVT